MLAVSVYFCSNSIFFTLRWNFSVVINAAAVYKTLLFSSEGGRRPLKQASIPIIAPGKCRRADWLGAEFTITDRMICAGYAHGGTDTCQVIEQESYYLWHWLLLVCCENTPFNDALFRNMLHTWMYGCYLSCGITNTHWIENIYYLKHIHIYSEIRQQTTSILAGVRDAIRVIMLMCSCRVILEAPWCATSTAAGCKWASRHSVGAAGCHRNRESTPKCRDLLTG